MALVTLVAVLPFFGELFTYLIDAPPLYALAKLWPLITLPLALFGAVSVRVAGGGMLLAALAWMAGITPLIGMATLGDSLPGALSGALKIWPLASAFSLAALLAWLKPQPRTLEAAIHLLGVATFAVMGLIWLIAPPEAYSHGIEQTKLFLSDPERGLRLNMPMMFGLMWLFLLNRRFWARPRLVMALLVIGGFAMMALIYKQRTQIAGAAAVVALAPMLRLARGRAAWFAVLVGVLALTAPILGGLVFSKEAASSLGGSLSARQNEFAYALRFLNDQPLRWLIGAGGATRAGEVDLAAVVGARYFFLSDLGWVGVLFEYGVVGAGLMLALHLIALQQGWRAAVSGSALGWMLFDYCLYLMVVSSVLSVVFAPGELACCLALLSYLARQGDANPCDLSAPGPKLERHRQGMA